MEEWNPMGEQEPWRELCAGRLEHYLKINFLGEATSLREHVGGRHWEGRNVLEM